MSEPGIPMPAALAAEPPEITAAYELSAMVRRNPRSA